METKSRAMIEDLYGEPGRAELVGGEIVRLSPAGDWPSFAAGQVTISIRSYVKRTGIGRAAAGNAAFVVRLPNRQSFCPDAAYYVGPIAGMKFFEGVPRFAVEVRNEEDYGPAAERSMAEKRRDYFAAGALAVWDVDLVRKEVVRVFRSSDPENPKIYHRGDIAEAEPAVPGWNMPVEDLFEPDSDESEL